MKPEQRKRIIDRHRDSLTRHGHHPNALYWSSRDIQEARFVVLAGGGLVAGESVLDVGCGFGDFLGWFEREHGTLDYTGVDLSPDLIAEARRLHSDACFVEGEVFDVEAGEGSFDWVVLSGALNELLHDEGDYARRVIRRMYALCRKGVAFNLLDARHLRAHDLQTHMPDEMLAWCKGLCPTSDLIDGYLKNDFTIYMHKGGKS